MQVTCHCSTRNPTTSTLSDKPIADMVKKDLDNISSHIQNNGIPSHPHVRAIFDDSVGSLADKIESSILYTGEKLGHLKDVQAKLLESAWFNFGEYSKEGPSSTQVLNSTAKDCNTMRYTVLLLVLTAVKFLFTDLNFLHIRCWSAV